MRQAAGALPLAVQLLEIQLQLEQQVGARRGKIVENLLPGGLNTGERAQHYRPGSGLSVCDYIWQRKTSCSKLGEGILMQEWRVIRSPGQKTRRSDGRDLVPDHHCREQQRQHYGAI